MSTGLDPAEEAEVLPYLGAYQYLVKCRNLGIQINATDLDIEMLDALHTIFETIQEINDKRGSKHGK